MSRPRSTPGPWRFNSNWDGEAVITTDAGEPVLQQVAPDAMHGGVDALDEDLQLMAAAPDLLEALKEIERASTWCMHIECMEPIGRLTDIARTAIARAEGREGV